MRVNERKHRAIMILAKAGTVFFFVFLSGRGGRCCRSFLVRQMAKEWAKQFYSSKRWQDCRNGYAAMRGYLCENCLKQGIYKPGAIVHHVEELTPLNITNPEIALGYSNLELLCRECHKEIHGIGGRWDAVNQKKKEAKRQRQRFTIDASGKVTARV